MAHLQKSAQIAVLSIGFVLLGSDAYAQGKTCVYNCTPPSGGGGTTYYYSAPPAPAGPSPAEIAAQQRRAAAIAAHNRGVEASRREDWQSAIRHYREALSLSPNDANTRTALGYALAGADNVKGVSAYSAGDYEQAAAAFEAALRNDPTNNVIRINYNEAMGQVAAKKGDTATAKYYFDQAVLLGSKNSEGLRHDLQQAEKSVETKRLESAIKPEVVARLNNLLADIQQSGNLNAPFSGSNSGTSTSSASGSQSGGLNFATGNLAAPPPPPNDPNVVDLRQSSGTAVNIAVTRPQAHTLGVQQASSQNQQSHSSGQTVDGVTTRQAKRQHEPLINPLRESERYREFLAEEKKRHPHLAGQIEKLMQGLDTDQVSARSIERLVHATKDMTAERRLEVMSQYYYRRSVLEGVAEENYRNALNRDLAPLMQRSGVTTRNQLDAKAASDPSLAREIVEHSRNANTAYQAEKQRAAQTVLEALEDQNKKDQQSLNFAR